MTTASDTRGRLLDAAEDLIRRHGFAQLSMGALAERTGIRKASIYHHFKDKGVLTREVVRRYATRFFTAADAIVANDEPGTRKLRRFLQLFERGLLPAEGEATPMGICLCGVLTGELDALEPTSRFAVSEFFADCEARAAAIFKAGEADGTLWPGGSVHDGARSLIAALEGAHLVARAHGDPKQFSRVARSLERLYAT